MNYLGRGAQYTVYELGKNRVKKIANTPETIGAVVLGWNDPEDRDDAKRATYIQQLQQDRARSIRWAKTTKLPAALLGNPEFLEGDNYIQDRVTILDEAIKAATTEEARALIDGAINSILTHWRYGFSDKTYNFTLAHGVTGSGEIILVDFGEITQDKARVLRDIKRQAWLQRYSYLSLLPPEHKPYFEAQAEQKLTLEILEKIWGTALN